MRQVGELLRLLGVGLVALNLCAYEIDLEGLNWREEKRLERLLDEVLLEEMAVFDETQAEDAILILRSELNRRGFLNPKIEYTLFSGGEGTSAGEWLPGIDAAKLPWRGSDRLVLRITRGERAYFETIRMDGLTTLDVEEAKTFFAARLSVFVRESSRAYSPAALDSGVASLRRRLAQKGRPDASVSLVEPPQIESTGEVSIHLSVDEGPAYMWGETSILGAATEIDVSGFLDLSDLESGKIFNDEALEDWIVIVRNAHLQAGYADVRIDATKAFSLSEDGKEVGVAVELVVTPGQRVHLGSVRYVGLERTDPSFLDREIGLAGKKWLNTLKIQEARYALARLGIFDEVIVEELVAEASEEVRRDVVFALKERDRYEMSLLFGYGSYEQLRIGAEARVLNLFGRAHASQLRLRQSFKSSAGSLLYSIPKPFPVVDLLQARLQGLARDELAFERQEALLAFGVQRGFFDGLLQTSMEYRFELLRSVDPVSEELVGDTRANVGSLLFELGWDTRDRAIAPTGGHSVQAQLELASPLFGSESYFQRLILRSTLHRSFDHQRLRWHVGLEAGVLGRVGAQAVDLPINKRFYLGGENSVRGYQDGEASPLDTAGRSIGAEFYALGHLEFEVVLLESISAVTFVDALWASPYLDKVSEGEALASLGLGLRYSTPLGPIRLEYGYNLNRRIYDPVGTLHFSIGFPF